jgi:hypothetical protein
MTAMIAALALQMTSPASPPADPCQVDRRALLALDQDAFDQNMSGGWRELAQRPGCMAAAADLIHAYRAHAESRLSILNWHEGQLRATLGDYAAAIPLLEASRKAQDPSGWNPYVDATVAFLRGDRAALAAARERLAAVPRPEGFQERVLANGSRVSWPMNLGVVDGLLHCFGRPYREAYSSRECRPPAQLPTGNH